MKTKQTLWMIFWGVMGVAGFFLSVGGVKGQTLLPENKVMTKLEADEPNPFSFAKKAAVAKTAQAPEVTEGEANMIFTALQKMSVSGYAEGPMGREVLIDRMRVMEGCELPPVIAKQTEVVRVVAIRPDRVEFALADQIDKKGKKVERNVAVYYSLKPEVRYMSGGQEPPRRTQSIDLQGVFPMNKKEAADEETTP